MSLPGWTQLIEVMDVASARRALAARLLRCPDCSATLRPWGHATARTVRDLHGTLVSTRPDRARCTGCKVTHVVLDAALLARRGYTAHVIGHALLGAAQGQTHRAIADQLDAPSDTVRGWIRRARRSVHHLWTLAVQAVVALDQLSSLTRFLSPTLTRFPSRSTVTPARDRCFRLRKRVSSPSGRRALRVILGWAGGHPVRAAVLAAATTRACGVPVGRHYPAVRDTAIRPGATSDPTWLNLVRSWLALDLLKSAAKVVG